MTTRWKNDKGHSLMELTLVLSLIGILAYTAMPIMNDTEIVSLFAAAKKVEADLQYAQSLATTTGEEHGFIIDGASTYTVYDVSTGDPVESPYHHHDMEEDIATSFPGVEFQTASGTEVEFDEIGQATTGNQTITLVNVNSGDTKVITVVGSTGAINMQ